MPETTDNAEVTATQTAASTESASSTTTASTASDAVNKVDSQTSAKTETAKELSADDLKLAAEILNQDWTKDLPDDLKETGKRFSSKADAVRAINDFRKRESQVRVPGKDAKPEEQAAYRKAIGVPEKPEEYEFPQIPDNEITDAIKLSRATWGQRLHGLGIPKSVAKSLIAFVGEDELKYQQELISADQEFVKAQEAKLRSEWKGEEYDRNKTIANNAFREIANKVGLNLEELTKIETKDGRFLMDRAEIVRMFAAIGREMSEGSLGPTLTDSEKDTADDQLRGIRSQILEAQAAGDSKRANKLYQQEQTLISRVSGNKPIVGARGRMI